VSLRVDALRIVVALIAAAIPVTGVCQIDSGPVELAREAAAQHGLQGGELWLRRKAESGVSYDTYQYYIYLLNYSEIFPDKHAASMNRLGVLTCLESRGAQLARANLIGELRDQGTPGSLALSECLLNQPTSIGWQTCRAASFVPSCPLKYTSGSWGALAR